MAEVTTIGLDIGKRVLQVHGADATGPAVFQRKLCSPIDQDSRPGLRVPRIFEFPVAAGPVT
jgi:hypothetical protein